MTTDLATEQRAVRPYEQEDEDEGSLGLGVEDFRPPQLRFSGKEGTFSFIGEDGAADSFTGVPLTMLADSRVKFVDDEESTEVECRSNDGVMPVDEIQAAKIGAGPNCAQCQFHEFTKDANGKTHAPLCTLFRNIAMASLPESDDEEPTPFLFAVKSTSIKPLLQVLNAVELRRRKAKPKLPGYAFALEFSAGPQAGEGKRKYYPLTAKISDERPSDELLPVYRGLWHYMREKGARLDITAGTANDAAAGAPVAPSQQQNDDSDPGPQEPAHDDPAMQGEMPLAGAGRGRRSA